jgi:hypothetical protein
MVAQHQAALGKIHPRRDVLQFDVRKPHGVRTSLEDASGIGTVDGRIGHAMGAPVVLA